MRVSNSFLSLLNRASLLENNASLIQSGFVKATKPSRYVSDSSGLMEKVLKSNIKPFPESKEFPENKEKEGKSPVKDVARSFAEALSKALSDVNRLQKNAQEMSEKFVLGEVDVHDVMIAMSKAKLALDFTLSVRNALIDAYREIIRMR